LVRQRRKERGLTQATLAQAIKLDPSSLARIERDERLPSLVVATRLIKALGLDREQVWELLTRERTAKRTLVEKKRAVLESDVSAEDLEALLQEIQKRKRD
jgi:DNA-binding XRE family transcriptional regulator